MNKSKIEYPHPYDSLADEVVVRDEQTDDPNGHEN